MVRTRRFHCWGPGSTPSRRAEIQQAARTSGEGLGERLAQGSLQSVVIQRNMSGLYHMRS